MSTMHRIGAEESMEHVRMERRGAVGIITMDRPERFNALDVRMAHDLYRAGVCYAHDDAVRCIVLAGGERVFCSGVDLKEIRRRTEAEHAAQPTPHGGAATPDYGPGFQEILEHIHRTISVLKRASKPVVASVKGVAAAGGFGLAMACDLVFASESAWLEWAYHKTGLTGAESSTFFLPRLLGLRKALGLMLLNPRLDARAALDAGLITGVFPVETFDQAVIAIADRLAAGPTDAYGVAKHLLHQAVGAGALDAHLDRELKQLVRIAGGADFAEGLAAFFAKREPVFGGGARLADDPAA